MLSAISKPDRETTVVGRPRAKYRAILLFGAPGSGKGTQGRLLGATPGFFHCACGDVFRALDIRSPLGRAFLDYSTRGELVPDEFTVGLWHKRLDDHVAASTYRPDQQWLVLDGIPRNRNQAHMMEAFIDVSLVLHLCCEDPAVLEERLGRRASEDGRSDDTGVEVVRRRLAVFESESLGVLDFYPREIVRVVDASAPPGHVLADILGHILGSGDNTSREPAR